MSNQWARFNYPLLGIASAPQQSTNLLDVQSVDGVTVREALSVILAALGGKTSKDGSTVTIRSADDSRNVIVATVTDEGVRSSVTLTP